MQYMNIKLLGVIADTEIFLGGLHHVARRGEKSIAKLDRVPWPDFLPTGSATG